MHRLDRVTLRRAGPLGFLLLLLFVLPSTTVWADDEPVSPVKPAPLPSRDVETPEPSAAQGKATWRDQAFLKKYLAIACDAVEEVCGAKFKQRPTIRITTKAEMVEILHAEMGATFQRLMDNDATAARGVSETVAQSLMAKYEPEKRIVHVLPGNMESVTELLGKPEMMNGKVLRVILAHECAHALDFERWPALDTARKNRPTEQGVQAVGAILEGHAQFVAQRVAAAWKLTPEFEGFSELIVAQRPEADVAERILAEVMTAQVRFAYVKGHAFFEAVYAARGRPGIEAALANPPEGVEVIERPALYLDPSLREAPVDPTTVLAAVDPVLATKGWPGRNVDLQKTQLEAAFSPVGAERMRPVFEQFRGGKARVGAKNQGTMIVFNVDWWKDAEAAKARLKLTRELLVKKDELIRAEGGAIKIKSSTTEEGAGPQDALEGFTHAKTMLVFTQEQKIKLHVARVGRFVLELTLVGVELDRAQQDEIMTRAKAAIEKLEGKKSAPEAD